MDTDVKYDWDSATAEITNPLKTTNKLLVVKDFKHRYLYTLKWATGETSQDLQVAYTHIEAAVKAGVLHINKMKQTKSADIKEKYADREARKAIDKDSKEK